MREKGLPAILVIDNDLHVAAAISKRLQGLGYSCMTAGTGEEGLERLSAGSVDLVITDLNMPGVNGLEMVERIRRHGGTPVIIITGYADDYRAALENLGDIAVLTKPFDMQALIDLIEVELALNRKQPAV